MATINRVYNRKRAMPKAKDKSLHFRVSPSVVNAVHSVDLRPFFPPVEDQKELGSCSSYAVGAAYQYNQIRQNEPVSFVPSHLFLYYCEREYEGTVNEDSGAMLGTGVRVTSKIGVVPERDWPYDISKFTVKPPDSVYATAANHRCTGYYRVGQTIDQIHQALINGFPVIIGVQVYPSFQSEAVAASGVVPMPEPGEACLGGHAILLVGFDNGTQRYIFRNSWGCSWGQNGYATIPYAYVADPNLADDIWVISSVVDATIAEPMPYSRLTELLNAISAGFAHLGDQLEAWVHELDGVVAAAASSILHPGVVELGLSEIVVESGLSEVVVESGLSEIATEPNSSENVAEPNSPEIATEPNSPEIVAESTPSEIVTEQPPSGIAQSDLNKVIQEIMGGSAIQTVVRAFVADVLSKVEAEIVRK